MNFCGAGCFSMIGQNSFRGVEVINRCVLRKSGPVAASMMLFLGLMSPMMTSAHVKLGPVWRTWNARVSEDKMDDYLLYLTKVYKYKLEAWKQAGLLTDYKIVIADPQTPDDWNVSFMFEYKNMAALDVPEEVWDRIGKKALDSVQDQQAKKMEDLFPRWRKFVGWGKMTREVVSSTRQ